MWIWPLPVECRKFRIYTSEEKVCLFLGWSHPLRPEKSMTAAVSTICFHNVKVTLYIVHYQMTWDIIWGTFLPAWNDISHISPTHMATDHFYGVCDRSLENLVESDPFPCQTLAQCVWEVLHSDNPSGALGILKHSGGSTAVWHQLRAGRKHTLQGRINPLSSLTEWKLLFISYLIFLSLCVFVLLLHIQNQCFRRYFKTAVC